MNRNVTTETTSTNKIAFSGFSSHTTSKRSDDI